MAAKTRSYTYKVLPFENEGQYILLVWYVIEDETGYEYLDIAWEEIFDTEVEGHQSIADWCRENGRNKITREV